MTLYCPLCREPDAVVTVNLADTSDFCCEECGESFTREDLDALAEGMKRWAAIFGWLDQIPTPESVK